MNKKALRKSPESPFVYLRRRRSGEPFPEETINNWYAARAFVLDLLKDISYAHGANDHLRVVVNGDSPLMCAVVRQLALSAHYINFLEYDQFGHLLCRNRTVITIVTGKNPDVVLEELGKEENLCNLLDYCKCTVGDEIRNPDSYLDLELEIVRDMPDKEGKVWIEEQDVTLSVEHSIDTRMAVCADKAYNLGAVINNLPYEDIFCVSRYTHALETFQRRVYPGAELPSLTRDENGDDSLWKKNLTKVKEGLSNVFCADCFLTRELGIKNSFEKNGGNYDKLSVKDRLAVWARFNHELSLSEHCRWVTEKLIMGYRPLNEKERNKYESLFGDLRRAYIKELKNTASSPAHIDLCSYRDLRRIDPDNLKYDSFLMLAIPLILDKIRKEDGAKP